MKNILLFCFFVLASTKSFSQSQEHRWNIAINLNGTEYFFQSNINPALQFRIGYDIKNKLGVYAAYMQHRSVNDDFKASIIKLAATPRAIGKYNSKLSLYFPTGFSVLSLRENIEKGVYKQTGLTLDLGAGLETGNCRLKFFAEIGAGIPLTEYKPGTLLSGYGSLNGNIGVKFSL